MGIAKRGAVTIYGIKNCDTMKKAFTWLDANGVEYEFHDYKKAGIDRALGLRGPVLTAEAVHREGGGEMEMLGVSGVHLVRDCSLRRERRKIRIHKKLYIPERLL